jgi:hypothetical protein
MAALEGYHRGGNYVTGNIRNSIPENDIYIKIIETVKSFRDRIDRTASFERFSAQDCIQAYST